jgi:hypothetical protein
VQGSDSIDINAWILITYLFVLYLGAVEIGYRAGRRLQPGADDSAKSEIMVLQSAVLGLLGLLLGFSFSMTETRYNTRKALVLEEANAIGTAWLRARLLPEPAATQAAVDLRRYVDLRLEWFEAGTNAERISQTSEAGEQLLNQVWSIAARVTASDRRSVATGMFIQSLNEVIDVKSKRELALQDRVPLEVFYLLTFAAACAMGLTGYSCGIAGRRNPVPTTVTALLIAAVCFTIVDLHRPRQGLIREPQTSLIDLRASMDRSARQQ